jgi:hypothetical protein
MLKSDRYSSPPCPERLDESTRRLEASLTALESKVGHLPMPAPAPRVPVTDEQRIAVLNELNSYWLRGKFVDFEEAFAAYRREAKGRAGR